MVVDIPEFESFIDFSLGDPLKPLTEIANYAFAETLKSAAHYHMNTYTNLLQQNILSATSNYFTNRGIYRKGYYGLGSDRQLITGGGTTEGYELIIRAIAEDLNRRAKATGEDLKPVIVMPSPTYGFFTRNPVGYGIECAFVPRALDNAGRLDPEAVREAFERIDRDGKRIVAWFDSNPNNPTGLIRERGETAALARIIMDMSARYLKRDEEILLNDNIPGGYQFRDSLSARIRIIDDMVYDGLQYEGQPEPFAFARLNHEDEFDGIFDDTFTLFGPSKAGLPGLRTGLVIGNDRFINDYLRQLQIETCYAPSYPAQHAVRAYFTDDEPHVSIRREHLARTNARYAFNGKFMKALVNGFEDGDGITDAEKERMIDIVECCKGIDRHEAAAQLRNGIPGLRVITTPQAGFFHLLDFSGFRGRHYDNALHPRKHFYGTTEFKDDDSIINIMDTLRMQVCGGSWMKLPIDALVSRVTFARPVKDIVELADRLGWAVKQLKPTQAPANKPGLAQSCAPA